jgi:two-component system, chemotaxis family, sensor kinase CheA
MDGMDDIVKEFIVESHENLDRVDRDLVALEKDPTSHELLAEVFRAIHTIKGTTGFLGFSRLESVTHAGENLLSKLRDGVLSLTPDITSGLLSTVDAVREMLANIESQGTDGNGDYASLIDTLTRLQSPGPAPTPVALPLPPPAKLTKKPTRKRPKQEKPVEAQPPVAEEPSGNGEQHAVAPADQLTIGEVLVRSGRATEQQIAKALEQQKNGDPRRLGEILVDQGVIQPGEALEALQTQKEIRSSRLSSSNIRVDVGQLDKLMNLVGELVLARNQVLQFSATIEDAAFLGTTQRLNLITTELQEAVMKTRMQPIENIWSMLPRVVRDLAQSGGKQVRVEMEGQETELDKTIIEAIKDPLTHMVRNSVDHGIEAPDRRTQAGKPAEGKLSLRAYHEGGQVNIEISDDGAGVDVERVKRKAIERGLVTPDQAARMNEREVINLLFVPGFSTAEKITNVSGRGVGMDVVKTNIEKIGGAVDLQSRPSLGTTLRIKIPLTLAIVPALIVTSGGERYAIPQINLLELVRLEGDESRKGIETIHGAPVYRLRGTLLPLVYLDRALGLVQDPGESPDGHRESAGHSVAHNVGLSTLNIVVLQADDRQFGLVVDEVNDTEEIVVKPLGKHLKGIEVFAGATIMGDGRVALILDVLGLARRSSVVSEVRERQLAVSETEAVRETLDERQSMLLFRGPDDGRMAIPLSLVTRLEEFPSSSLEKAGSQQVVQYRGSILPLVRIASLLPERRRKPRRSQSKDAAAQNGKVQVVVHTSGDRTVGLVVDRILDIVEENLGSLQEASRDGIRGSIVIQGRVTEILDLAKLVRGHPGCSAPETACVALRN